MPLLSNPSSNEIQLPSSCLEMEDIAGPETREKVSGIFFMSDNERKIQARKCYETAIQSQCSDEEKKKELEYALTLDPTLWDAWEWIGYYWESRQNYKKAVEAYEEVLDVKRNDPDFLEMLATQCEVIGRHEDAAALYEDAKNLPNY